MTDWTDLDEAGKKFEVYETTCEKLTARHCWSVSSSAPACLDERSTICFFNSSASWLTFFKSVFNSSKSELKDVSLERLVLLKNIELEVNIPKIGYGTGFWSFLVLKSWSLNRKLKNFYKKKRKLFTWTQIRSNGISPKLEATFFSLIYSPWNLFFVKLFCGRYIWKRIFFSSVF